VPETKSAPPDALGAAELHRALDWIGTPVVLLDLRGAILHANAALEDLLGLSRRALAATPFARWLADAHPLERALRAARAGEPAAVRFAAELVGAGHPGLPMLASVRLSDTGDCVVVDLWPLHLEARREREERLREQADAHRELVRNLAHEIRNPLGGIRGAAQLLALELPSPELQDYTRVIVHEADRLRTLVDRLLEPHHLASQRQALNIHEVCEHVRALVQAEHAQGLALLRDYDASLPELHGDRGQLVQAVLNIVGNAAQALHDRIRTGDAEIVLRTRVARRVVLGPEQHRMAVVLEIVDNGPGIPQALRERIFLPLVTGRQDGTGLGLTLAQAIVQRHGGVIECDSRPGCTRFAIVLPLVT